MRSSWLRLRLFNLLSHPLIYIHSPPPPQRNRKQRTSKVASLMEGAEGDSSDPSEGAGAIGKGAGAAQLAAIKVRCLS